MFSKIADWVRQYLSDSARQPSGEDVDPGEKVKRLVQFAGEALIIGQAISPALAGLIGRDYMGVYHDPVLTGTFGVWLKNPWPIVWLAYPFAVLPLRWGAFLWGLVQAAGFIYALRRFQGHPLWFALSVPCIWTFQEGQFEGFTTWGLVLGMTAPPILAGLGLALLSLKPQFGLLIIFFILYYRRDWRLLIVPATVYGLSLIVWGFWIDDWLLSLSDMVSINNPVNTGLFPYALVLLPLVLPFKDVRIWAIVQALVMPYFGFYSIAPVLTMKWQSRWAIPLIVLASWPIHLFKFEPLPFLPSVQWISVVLIIALILEGRAYLREKTIDLDKASMLHSDQSSIETHGED